jgi:hypothetical protein
MRKRNPAFVVNEDVRAIDYLQMQSDRKHHNKLVARRKREDRRECFAMALLTIFFAFMIIVVMLGLGQVWEMIY